MPYRIVPARAANDQVIAAYLNENVAGNGADFRTRIVAGNRSLADVAARVAALENPLPARVGGPQLAGVGVAGGLTRKATWGELWLPVHDWAYLGVDPDWRSSPAAGGDAANMFASLYGWGLGGGFIQIQDFDPARTQVPVPGDYDGVGATTIFFYVTQNVTALSLNGNAVASIPAVSGHMVSVELPVVANATIWDVEASFQGGQFLGAKIRYPAKF